MNILELIEKKKNKIELTKEEYKFIVDGYVKDELPDYQVAALTMALWFNGLTPAELGYYTEAMMHSGDVIDLTGIDGIKVDKHSTGGVGDKVTLILAPLVAAAGGKVAKMSGKGLGFTGGTLDKLESIPGFQIERSDELFEKQIKDIGLAVIGQTENLVPGDKKFYALRDVTGTVDSIPLIAASIMSKKLATGSDAIFLDVKAGDGAFMKTYEDAEALGKAMITIGKELGRDVQVGITSMDQPLGKNIGNKCEVLEAVGVLSGHGHSDIREICLFFASHMLVEAKVFEEPEEARVRAEELLDSGEALEKFKEWIAYQGGDINELFKDDFWNPKFSHDIIADKSGYMNILSAVKFGLASVELGAGRRTKADALDYEAGIRIHKKSNEKVTTGEPVFTLYSSNPITENAINILEGTFEIKNEKTKKELILGKLG